MNAGTPEAGGLERVGIIVPIPEPEAARLSALRQSIGDEFAFIPPHLTLVTGVGAGDWDRIVAHVRAVAARTEPFTVRFAGTATFRPLTPVVYIPALEGAQRCEALHAALQTGPLEAQSAYPFVPHVTLAQGVAEDILDAVQSSEARESFTLRVDTVALYGDRSDNKWEIRDVFPLKS